MARAFYQRLFAVTPEIIASGITGDSSRCLVVMAIKVMCPEVNRVLVDGFSIRMTNAKTGMRYSFQTPIRVQRYIIEFDAGAKIEPFTFRLDNPRHITKVQKRKPAPDALDVSKASQKEVKKAIKTGRDIKGKTQIFTHDKERRPIAVGGDSPRTQSVIGLSRRYGFRALSRRYMAD